MKTVAFFGQESMQHANYENIRRKLYNEMEKLLENGVRTFMLLGCGEFDRMCAIAVKFFKMKYPDIESVLVSPYPKRNFDKDLYDKNGCPPFFNIRSKTRKSQCNEYMIKHADVVIVCLKNGKKGGVGIITYANKMEKKIIEIE